MDPGGLLRCRTALIFVAVCVAQPFLPAAPQQPTFRTATQSVEVDVTVQDAHGNFVADLRRDEFEVLEDGTPQQIDTVFLVSAPAAAAGAAPGPPSANESATAPLPRVTSDRRFFIFYFDTNHISSPASLDRARRAMSGFLQMQFRSGDVGGIVSDGKMLGNRLTSSIAELRSAAESVNPSGTMRSRQLEFREWPRLRDDLEALRIAQNDTEAYQNALARACAEQPDGCRTAEQMIPGKAARLAAATRVASQNTLRSAEALVSGLSRLPGLKVVVFFSDGFVVEDNVEPLRAAVGRAGRAGVRFYTIDLRGLNRSPDIIDAPAADDPAGAPAQVDLQSDATNSLAVDTGGLAFRNYNEFGKPLAAIAQDTSTYYVIGYRPTNQEFDGTFRKIAVRVKRPGVKVRARQGYVAIPEPQQVRPSPTESAPATAGPPVSHEGGPTPTPGSSRPGEGGALAAIPSVPMAAAAVPLASSRRDARERLELLRTRDAGPARATPSAAASSALAKAGWEKYEQGNVEGARADLARAAGPDARPWVFYALGLSEFALQRYDRAIAAWTVVRERVPDFESVYFDLADAWLQQGELARSVAILREAASRWPRDPEVFNALGVIFARRDALDEAVEAFRTAVSLAPGDALGHFNLARAHHMKFAKSRRYVAALGRWIQSDADRKQAIAEYNRYLEIGGPQETSAREALRVLNQIW